VIALKYPFLLLAVIPLLWIAVRNPYHWGIPSAGRAGAFSRLYARAVPILLVVALVLAASGLEWRTPARGMAPGVDFAVLLDGSSSMLAMDDGQEDRWTAAKRLLRQFISRRPDDRFSIVLFSAHPVTLSPLTADYAAIDGILEALPLDSSDDGTAIGSALMTGIRRLSQSPASSRVVVLLTDGAQNRGRVTPQEAALDAVEQGIRVYTVLMGSAGRDSVYPIDGHFYRLRVETDPDTLKEIAQTTGGEAFLADDPSGLERGLKAIYGLEKTALPMDAPTEGKPLARWLLVFSAALVLPLAADLARKRGKVPPKWLLERGS